VCTFRQSAHTRRKANTAFELAGGPAKTARSVHSGLSGNRRSKAGAGAGPALQIGSMATVAPVAADCSIAAITICASTPARNDGPTGVPSRIDCRKRHVWS